MLNANIFFDEALKVIEKLRETQMNKIVEAGRVLSDAMMKGGVIHVFGSGHSNAFAMEMVYRAGGLVPTHRITLDDLALRGIISADNLLDPNLERDHKMAHKLWGLYDIREGDAFIIVSNSGRNGTIVEFASMVKERNMPLIVVTSLDHSKNTTSRHSSGKKLYQYGDIVIDNCGPKGDAMLAVEGLSIRVNSISSVTGAFIAQGITSEIIRAYADNGITPPVYISANVDGGDKHNEELRNKYKGRI